MQVVIVKNILHLYYFLLIVTGNIVNILSGLRMMEK